jgi:hypothetical protein
MQTALNKSSYHLARLMVGKATLWQIQITFKVVLITLATLGIIACSSNMQPGMLIDRIKNRGPINISTSNPYLVANQYLDYQRKHSVDIQQFLKSRGAPAALEIQKPIFEDAQIFLYYPENGQYYVLTEGAEHWAIAGPYKLSGRKMYQVHDVVQAIPVGTR